MFASAPYVSLATFRRDGRKVATPIWAAPLGDELVMFSAPDAGKVKRLRVSPKAELAVCDVRGGLKSEWSQAKAYLVDDPVVIQSAEQAMRKKYGWQSFTLDALSRLSGRLKQRQYIRIEVLE